MKLFINEQQKSHQKPNFCYICQQQFEYKHAKNKTIGKIGIIFIIQGNKEVLHIEHVICNIIYLKKFL